MSLAGPIDRAIDVGINTHAPNLVRIGLPTLLFEDYKEELAPYSRHLSDIVHIRIGGIDVVRFHLPHGCDKPICANHLVYFSLNNGITTFVHPLFEDHD